MALFFVLDSTYSHTVREEDRLCRTTEQATAAIQTVQATAASQTVQRCVLDCSYV
jgi:hypothetical protein